VTWKEYETGVEDRLKDLHGRVHRGAYRAMPSKRGWIKKANGKMRPLGIAALEDKIVQQAVVTVLNQIYEEDFRGFSYGFRPGRQPHQALDALYVGLKRKKVNWVLDIGPSHLFGRMRERLLCTMDLKGFFDNIEKERLMEMVEQRIADPRILRLIRRADQWRRDAKGDVILVRYADDAVIGFQDQHEAKRFVEALRQAEQVWIGTERREDAVDPVWAFCAAEPGGTWGGKARVVHLSGIPACLCGEQSGAI